MIREEGVIADEEPDDSVPPGRPTDIWMGLTSNEQLNAQRGMLSPNILDNMNLSMGIINSGLIGRNMYERHFRNRPSDRFKIIKNIPRMTHYKKEKNVGKGYIKELCFSADGRIVCSPYDKGVRLLGFNEHLDELCYCVPEHPIELFTLAEMNDYHSDVVLTCKFSPRHYQMVSGCLGGEIVWYRPIL